MTRTASTGRAAGKRSAPCADGGISFDSRNCYQGRPCVIPVESDVTHRDLPALGRRPSKVRLQAPVISQLEVLPNSCTKRRSLVNSHSQRRWISLELDADTRGQSRKRSLAKKRAALASRQIRNPGIPRRKITEIWCNPQSDKILSTFRRRQSSEGREGHSTNNQFRLSSGSGILGRSSRQYHACA